MTGNPSGKAAPKPLPESRERITRRALAAYYGDPDATGWPDHELSGVIKRGGLWYAVVQDREGALLACYRVRHDGKLKLMKSPPSNAWISGS